MIIKGALLKGEIFTQLKQVIGGLLIPPALEIIQVGNNPASNMYISKKLEAANELGVKANLNKLSENVDNSTLIGLIKEYNANRFVHGILVQLPLPTHLDTLKILNTISPEKDVDGLTIINQGKLFAGLPGILPCTPRGIVHMIKSVEPNIYGKHAVIIGRSLVVGKPLYHLLLGENCSVTTLHSKSQNMQKITSQADILVSAAGSPGLITDKYVKEDAIVIDVGISKVNGKSLGDVDFDKVVNKARAISPVPGGVGPLTVAMLMHNLVDAASTYPNLQK